MRPLLVLVLVLAILPALPARAQPPAAPRAQVATASPWIGIAIEAGLRGVRVKQVMEATPAEKAGLRPGDEVLTIDGKGVKKPGELIARVQDKGVGETVALGMVREGKELTVTLSLEARPDELEMLRKHLLDKPAPALALEDRIGPYSARLSEHLGQVVVIEFWATWCGPCRSSIPRLNAWQEKYGPRGLRVLGVSSEAWAVVRAFAAKKKLAYTVAADLDSKASQAYLVPAIPMLVVMDRQGVVRFVDVGAGSKLDAAEAFFVPLLDPEKKP